MRHSLWLENGRHGRLGRVAIIEMKLSNLFFYIEMDIRLVVVWVFVCYELNASCEGSASIRDSDERPLTSLKYVRACRCKVRLELRVLAEQVLARRVPSRDFLFC